MEAGAALGPFCHLRPLAHVGPDARIGNFVELKKARIGRGAKVPHLSYVGDATLGADVNFGAGAITCNYDGVNKNETVIGDGAFIGTNSALVAPLTVGDGAYVAAGSVITKDVPADALAVARGRQVIREGWARRKKKPHARHEGGLGHVWNRRLHRRPERRRHHPRGSQEARVPRLRLGGRRRGRARGPARSGAPRAASRSSRDSCASGRSPAVDRHRPHPLGHARAAHRRERAPAHRRLGHARRRPQRHHRELPARSRSASRPRGTVHARETDTEVFAHLVERASRGDAALDDAVRRALRAAARLYAIAVV